MAYKNAHYRPNQAQRAILERGLEHVNSMAYRATARWLFYRLLQEGYYKASTGKEKKAAYNNFLGLTSRARHNNWGGWRPDTLSDDTRQSVEHGAGDRNAQEWAEGIAGGIEPPRLDHWYSQETYVEVWFEAEAMRAQFEYYTRDTTLRPFKGDASIDYKWRIAKSLEESAEKYDLPIVGLYFGDDDEKGRAIPKIAVADVRRWCSADFDFVRVGLNPGDGERLGIPDNPDKPGEYQWEALPDDAAREMIIGAVGRYVDADIIDEVERESVEAGRKLSEYVHGFSL
jgi:hypothetical protein